MLACAVMVWAEDFSHVEGVVVRQRRVWMSARPLAPSPAATVARYNGEAALQRHARTTCGAEREGVGCVKLWKFHMSIKVEVLCLLKSKMCESSHGFLCELTVSHRTEL